MSYLLYEYGMSRIDARNITHISGARQYSVVHLRGGRYITLSRSLNKLIPHLPGFERIHKGYLINPDYITSYTPDGDSACGVVHLGKIKLPVARRRRRYSNPMPVKANARLDYSQPITHAVGADNYSILHYPDGSSILIAHTLLKMEKAFGLLRIHHGTAINTDYVARLGGRGRALTVKMQDGTELPIGRRRAAEIKQKLTQSPTPIQ